MAKKLLIRFVYSLKSPQYWDDGLRRAVMRLETLFDVEWHNLSSEKPVFLRSPDFVLGWGAFGSPVDLELRKPEYRSLKKGLCIAGNAVAPYGVEDYDVLFYETEWYRPQIAHHKNIYHAFGINEEIYQQSLDGTLFDYITVGAYALWKRHELFVEREGLKISFGEIQEGNLDESLNIVGMLLARGVIVSGMVMPEQLARFYNLSETAYIPADINGGGERAVLEARACGCDVEVEKDNPKLLELCNSPIYDSHYYTDQLLKGIESCVS